MRMVDIIEKKRDGGKLTKEEIEFFVNGYVNEEIPDYQASALLMAIYFRHMDYDETLNLTLAMETAGTSSICLLLTVLKWTSTVQAE